MSPNAQHVQHDDTAAVENGQSYTQATQDSAPEPTTPLPTLSEITMQELMQVEPFVQATSESSIIPTSTSVTIVGDTANSGSTVEQGSLFSTPLELDHQGEDAPSNTEASTQVHPQTSSEVALAPTLGRLFTDGGNEELLIEVMRHLKLKDIASCLRVCENSNAVMVGSSKIQYVLRHDLYGYGNLFKPAWIGTLIRKVPRNPNRAALKNAIEFFRRTQGVIEHATYKSMLPERFSRSFEQLEDVQGNCILLSRSREWSIIEMPHSITPWNVRDAPDSEFSLSAEDKVVVETIGDIMVDNSAIVVRPYEMKNSGPPRTSTQHPGAKREEIIIVFLISSSVQSIITHVPVRLYRGGFGAVLLTEVHSCDIDPRVKETRLVMFNWQRDTGVGKIKIPDCTVKILDFRFLSEFHLACSSIRKINGSTYPCIDLYLMSPYHNKNPVADPEGNPRGILRSLILPNSTEFAIRVPRPEGTAGFLDHAMTFRLGGQVGGKSEKLEGVILVSRLFEFIREGRFMEALSNSVEADKHKAQNPSSTSAAATARLLDDEMKNYENICFKWQECSSAVSLQHSTSSTVLEPRNTQVASIARSPTDEKRAVMVIRDYNQRMLLAPPGHLTRNLGHPTDNCDPGDRREEQRTGNEVFTTVNETRIVRSILFGKDVEYGLGHRVRTMDLGVYPHDTYTSRLFWSAEYMQIVPPSPGDSFLIYMFEPVDNLMYAKKKEAAPAET